MNSRLRKVVIQNIKNVEYGEIVFPRTDLLMSGKEVASSVLDIIGIYGQNGSGKTAAIEVLDILQVLLSRNNLNYSSALITHGMPWARIDYFFFCSDASDSYEVKYSITLQKKEKVLTIFSTEASTEKSPDRVFLSQESVSYRKIKSHAKKAFKSIISHEISDELTMNIYSDFFDSNQFLDSTLNQLLGNQLDHEFESLKTKKAREVLAPGSYQSYEHSKSFIFTSFTGLLSASVFKEEQQIALYSLFLFGENMNVVTNLHSSISCSGLMLPLHSIDNGDRKTVVLGLSEPETITEDEYDCVVRAIAQINVVLKIIVPDLTAQIESIGSPILENGEKGQLVQLTSTRHGRTLPLNCESSGIIKLISILSLLITVYQDAHVFVAIDELDAGIYEFLLGQILNLLKQKCKGQFIFTSHNLRALEVLNEKNILLTTTNHKNRFVHLSGLKRTNNRRDVYLRAIQLGGQEEEELASEVDSFYLEQAFGGIEV